LYIYNSKQDIVSQPSDHADISKLLHKTFSSSSAWKGVISHKNGTVSSSGQRGRLWFYPVDNKHGLSDPTLDEVQQVIQEKMLKEKYVNHKVPFAWLGVFEKLQQEAENGACTINLAQALGLCADCGMPSVPDITLQEESLAMLKFFHELGYVMYHDEPALRELVVLDPVSFAIRPTSRIMCQLDIHEDRENLLFVCIFV
jgi:hypothetical protein